jgi:uncharacterized membrane protein YbhN (UPF0104 family)
MIQRLNKAKDVMCAAAIDHWSLPRAPFGLLSMLRGLCANGWRGVFAGLASLTLFGIAAFVLTQTFSHIDFGALRNALSEISGAHLLEAAFFTALSYIALTGYDAAALKQIRARAPYSVIALASFASYAVSFNLGFTVITGAAIRYWIYSRQKITALQVANITLVASMTFWLGLTATLGLGLLAGAGPLSAIDGLPAAVNAVLGALALLSIPCYCVWVAQGKRSMRVRGQRFQLPGPLTTLAQTLLGTADIYCAAAALFCLLPEGHGLDFLSFGAIYVFACILGVISHAPGGIGIFEATMLNALPGHSQEGLLASLLVFRIVYYFVPFIIALALLGASEGARRWSGLRDAVLRGVDNRV